MNNTTKLLKARLDNNQAFLISNVPWKGSRAIDKPEGGFTLEALQNAVGGLIELVRVDMPGLEDTLLVVQEEGFLNGSESNLIASLLSPAHIHGPALLVKADWID
jgi:hypothetical protein